jgi:hypothetical protein
MYRTANGLKCAVGALIPDEAYTPSLEGKSPNSWQVQKALDDQFGEIIVKNDVAFLGQLQRKLHDDWVSAFEDERPSFINFVTTQAELFAKGWNLKLEIPA